MELRAADHVAVAVEVHVGRRGERGGLAEIDERLAAVGELDGHEAAAADVAGRGEHHAERVADGDRRVDGVAALLQDVDADLGREVLARDHHAVARADRQRRGRMRGIDPEVEYEGEQDRRAPHGATAAPSMPCRASACATNPDAFIVATKSRQVPGSGGATARRSHRLVDHHEPAVEDAQAGEALRIRFELLLHAGGDVELSREEEIDDFGRRRRADERRMLQLARQIEVVGAARADRHPRAGAIDLRVVADRRIVGSRDRRLR